MYGISYGTRTRLYGIPREEITEVTYRNEALESILVPNADTAENILTLINDGTSPHRVPVLTQFFANHGTHGMTCPSEFLNFNSKDHVCDMMSRNNAGLQTRQK